MPAGSRNNILTRMTVAITKSYKLDAKYIAVEALRVRTRPKLWTQSRQEYIERGMDINRHTTEVRDSTGIIDDERCSRKRQVLSSDSDPKRPTRLSSSHRDE